MRIQIFFRRGWGWGVEAYMYIYNVHFISSDGGNSRSAHVSLVYRIYVRTASILNLKGHYSIITQFFVQCLSFRLATISWTVRCITNYLTNRIKFLHVWVTVFLSWCHKIKFPLLLMILTTFITHNESFLLLLLWVSFQIIKVM